jgi:hypothetical protein
LPRDAGNTVNSPPCSRHVPWTNQMPPSPTPIPRLDGFDLDLTWLFEPGPGEQVADDSFCQQRVLDLETRLDKLEFSLRPLFM